MVLTTWHSVQTSDSAWLPLPTGPSCKSITISSSFTTTSAIDPLRKKLTEIAKKICKLYPNQIYCLTWEMSVSYELLVINRSWHTLESCRNLPQEYVFCKLINNSMKNSIGCKGYEVKSFLLLFWPVIRNRFLLNHLLFVNIHKHNYTSHLEALYFCCFQVILWCN